MEPGDEPPPRLIPRPGVETAALSFSSGGAYLLAIPPAGGTASVAWPIRDTTERIALLGHRAGVPAVAFAPGGRLVASGSQDREVKIWDPRTGAPVASHAEHGGAITGLAFSPDGGLLASSDGQGLILVREPAAGGVLARVRMPAAYPQIVGLEYDPRGRYLAALSEGWLAVWTVRRGPGTAALETLASFPIEGSIALAVHASGASMAGLDRSGRVFGYDAERGRLARVAGLEAAPVSGGLEFGRDGDRLYSITRDGGLGAWGWGEGRAGPSPAARRGAGGFVRSSPDGCWLATRGRPPGGRRHPRARRTWPRPQPPWPPEPGARPGKAAWGPDVVAAGRRSSDGGLSVWDPEQVRRPRRRGRRFELALDASSRATAPAPPAPGPAMGVGEARSPRRPGAGPRSACRSPGGSTRRRGAATGAAAAEAQDERAEADADDHLPSWLGGPPPGLGRADREAYRRPAGGCSTGTGPRRTPSSPSGWGGPA